MDSETHQPGTRDPEASSPPIMPLHSSGKTSHDFGTDTTVGDHGRHHHSMGEATADELRRIATALSVASRQGHDQDQPNIDAALDSDLDAALDPTSKHFDVTMWLRDFVNKQSEKGSTLHGLGFMFKDLSVYGSGAALQLQDSISSVLSAPFRPAEFFGSKKAPRRQILHGFNGLVRAGELLAVLGRPGSGCSTFLKTMCGELYSLELDKKSVVEYDGIPQDRMKKEFKGELVYNQEVDKHFPHLTVGQTLEFAAAMRTPSNRIMDMSRDEYCQYMARVVMAMFGLSHTYHTKVGNDYVRGVSGGERKRVSIAEMMLAESNICAWDNSTRGLDSSSALKFVEALRVSSDIGVRTHAVAMYQASQAIYDVFDKTTVLYEGRQIYFGPASAAKHFFEKQGWECPARQTTGDFLTSVTNPMERIPKPGMEDKVPRTPEEFERYWLASPEFAALQSEMAAYSAEFSPSSGDSTTSKESLAVPQTLTTLRESKARRQAKHVRPRSPYIISIPMQIRFNTKRAYQRLWNDLHAPLSMMFANLVLALIIGSIFYGNAADATAGFSSKGSTLFMALLLNALTAISEIEALYAQRPIVEKHHSYAFYHPATEAAAGIVADIPIKFATATVFNLLAYFLSGLHREPGQFFLYFLISYLCTFVMSAVFRTLAAVTKTVSQAMALAGVMAIALIMYTGFIVAVPEMHPWFGWIRHINPLYYAFEILVANEFHGREFICSDRVPPYPNLPAGERSGTWICAAAGAVPGRETVSGDAYIATTYSYYYSHVWRNFGILIAFLIFFMAMYFLAVEMNSDVSSTAEMLVFRRGGVPSSLAGATGDEEGGGKGEVKRAEQDTAGKGVSAAIEPQKDIFTWKDVVYDVPVKSDEGTRRLLDHVSGWVKPGTLTALMGASGAGKTTLLDVLAQRTNVGVVTGDMLVNGRPFGADFQRQTGYVQQQDLHLDTSTVRESLRFSAMLRRPPSVSTAEKYAFVEEVIKMLGMEEYADAVVGIPGQGLNVEQRKLLTIGVELVAKPKLLLFLDEPTSGLDSQSAWAICVFLRKLADAGQAVLCTIHQPNALLFQQFDRLLFLAKGGKTVYFGDIGRNSQSLLTYFETNGARQCGDQENPAEYMLEIVAEGTNSSGLDWHSVWKASPNCKGVMAELDRIHAAADVSKPAESQEEQDSNTEFAMPFYKQVYTVTERIFQQYWRMPGYVLAKLLLGAMSGLFIGFTFWRPDGTQAGMRGVIFAVFKVTTIFTTLVQQIQPLFITQRSLYEVRERPSKVYSWKAFIIANIVVEIPYQILTGILTYACFYYPVMGTAQASSRQGLILLFTIQLFIYSSAFAHMTIVAMPDAQAAAGVVILLTMMSIIFSGVLQTKVALPGFWVFMYYLSPFTYWISGIVSTMLHGRPVECSLSETLTFSPPPGMNLTCAQYLGPMFEAGAPGLLQNPGALEKCRYCAMSVADEFMAMADIYWGDRWRNFGIMWVYIVFNIGAAVVLYYLFRVKKWGFGGKSKNE
ncbi:putative ATP-binding cassette transporter [Rhypophila decipiens]|uniref:ATP-binding cassette transporter n=1 Tax=Rhypophila decipiens TaxID=261697 RepID=A0AAN7B3V8_9PEZI|nr:putative ATP-binding cassette transporter [Rhypophila decipiens]